VLDRRWRVLGLDFQPAVIGNEPGVSGICCQDPRSRQKTKCVYALSFSTRTPSAAYVAE
jgi:hypothetical protein